MVRWPIIGLLFAVSSCGSRSVPGPDAGVDFGVRRTEITVPQAVKNMVDLLFMVDNSASMGPIADELKARFGQLVKVFQDLAAKGTYVDLHIGVVTSDYGAGATGAPGCQPSPGGQQGRLVSIGAYAPLDCEPPLGANFIKYAFAANGGGVHNLPRGQDLLRTFTCMASVITNQSAGCGFEHPLESVYAALRNSIPENVGFLREGALLEVVFVTNEDDCSAPIDSDLFDKNRVAQYGFLASFRCNRFGHICGNPPAPPPYGSSPGALGGCVPAPNLGGGGPGKLYDVSRYVDFFTKPASQGGVKANPKDVILTGIMPPSEPYQVILSNPGTPGNQPYVQCGQLAEASNPPCVPVVQHSCQNPAKPQFFGDPAVRIAAVIKSAANHQITSVCDDSYAGALGQIGNLIVATVGGGCFPAPLVQPPDCDAFEVTINPDGTTTTIRLPACGAAGLPCWRFERKAACATISPDGLGLTVDRGGRPARDGTSVKISCLTR